MNGRDLHDAMEFVGPDLIDMAETARFSPSLWRTLLATAACAILLCGLGTVLAGQSLTTVPEVPPEAAAVELEHQPAEPAEEPEICDPATPEEAFYAWFPHIDRSSMESYIQANPETLAQGWDRILINEAGPDDPGTEIRTTQGDSVLAIDAENQILLIRVTGDTYRGVLAIANKASRLRLAPSSQLGIAGETVGTIAQANHGILAINGSGFKDMDGTGNGGLLYGYAMCSGISYNAEEHLSDFYRRLEIDKEGVFRLAGIQEPIGEDTLHAVEFGPALLKDGEILVDESCGFTGKHPRAVIGQGENNQILMLVIEGRLPGYSEGTDVMQCADLLAGYGCQTALNLDGGTSAILWYDGECVTRCSNSQLSEGRNLPNAFVLTAE